MRRPCSSRATRSGLSGALLKIAGASAGSRLVTPEAEEVAHMLFAAGLPRLFATHPPIEERLKALDPALQARASLPTLAARSRARLRNDSAPTTPRASAIATGGSQRQRQRHSRRRPIAAFADHAAHDIAALAGTIANENVRYAENARSRRSPKACVTSSTPPITRAR